MNNIEKLVASIQETNQYFLEQVHKQVNIALTVRNWVIGYYIVEYEQSGEDKATYGDKILKTLSERLKQTSVKGLSETNLKLFRQFYQSYPQISQTVSDQSFIYPQISQTLSDQLKKIQSKDLQKSTSISPALLLNRLSFSHFIELFKAESPLKRSFYETEAIKNNWSVRDLQRAMNSMLYERTGLSTDKKMLPDKKIAGTNLVPEDVFRNPYMLEFLGLEEKAQYSETDLEQAITGHLHTFLLEMGRGFCFEARQKRITFDNTHYRIDLVFYHRILKCHVLIDLKLGEFTHTDAGQMNVYLNFYRENEMSEGDNPPVGIILCASKNESLVKYATTGLPQQVFVSKYLINLPSEAELKKIIEEEQKKLN